MTWDENSKTKSAIIPAIPCTIVAITVHLEDVHDNGKNIQDAKTGLNLLLEFYDHLIKT